MAQDDTSKELYKYLKYKDKQERKEKRRRNRWWKKWLIVVLVIVGLILLSKVRILWIW